MRAFPRCVIPTLTLLLLAAMVRPAPAQDNLSPFTRITLGLEQTGASAATTATTFLVDFNLTGPLLMKVSGYDHVPRFSAVGDFRFNSVTQTGGVAVKDFLSTISSRPGELNLNQVAQGLRFGIGGEATFSVTGGFGAYKLPGDAGSAKSHLAPSLFFTYGATTPLSAVDRMQVHKFDTSVVDQVRRMQADEQLPPEFQPLLDLDPDVIKNVAFVSSDRDRFYHHAYVGFRLKTYDINTESKEIVATRGTIDLGWGFDEELTGGEKTWKVLMINAFYKLPKTDLFVFGDVRMHHTPAALRQPLIMKAADAINVPAADTAILPVPERDRDVWKLGVGVDLIPLLTR